MNLSNLTLIANNKLNEVARERIAVASGLFILFISAFLGMFFYEEDPNATTHFFWMKIIAALLVSISAGLSYGANKYAFNDIK